MGHEGQVYQTHAEKGVQIREQIRQAAGEGRQVRLRQPTEGQGLVDDHGCLKKTCWPKLSPVLHPTAACPPERPTTCLTACLSDRDRPPRMAASFFYFRLTGNRADKPPVLAVHFELIITTFLIII